ncbi:MAG: MerR family transcriptional regulator [Taibaiella sp.]|nr:MerR family transcriptional regulator [Taibaiella sp.]
MSTRILTLFGEEIVPEPQKPVPRPRASKPDKPEAVESDVADTNAIADTVNETIPELPTVENTIVEVADQLPTPVSEEQTNEKSPPEIIPEDWNGEKNYYGIGEVADFFKVKTSHIRFWTNEFKLKVRTTRKGDRLYTPEQVKELRAIYHLVKGRGFTLSGAKAKLKTQNKRDVTTVDLRSSLTQLRDKLVILRNQLV